MRVCDLAHGSYGSCDLLCFTGPTVVFTSSHLGCNPGVRTPLEYREAMVTFLAAFPNPRDVTASLLQLQTLCAESFKCYINSYINSIRGLHHASTVYSCHAYRAAVAPTTKLEMPAHGSKQ